MSRVYWMETKTEFLKLGRMRVYTMSTLLFPLIFYCFFGLAMGRERQPGFSMEFARYLLATYGAFTIVSATLYALGVGVAVERGLGWLEVKRASPMPASAYFTAKVLVASAFGATVVMILFSLGAIFGGVHMPPGQWLLLGITLLAGAIPFSALGLAIGGLAGANSAPATVNLTYMPLALCGGLWMPIEVLPKSIQRIAEFLPTYHFGQLALSVLRPAAPGAIVQHISAMLAFTLVFTGVAWLAYARERQRVTG